VSFLQKARKNQITSSLSADNGSSWDNVTHGAGNKLAAGDVSFGNNTFVGVSSVSGIILRSTDNGENWNSMTSGTTESLRGVGF
jgi:photosystem II stability/assembly factor-like uncharacterized protein